MTFRKNILLQIILALLVISCNRTEIVTLTGLLDEMVSRESITKFPDPVYKLKQFSSYDRRSISHDQSDWFANEDYTNFLGIDSTRGRREFVMYDHSGPGAIVRWWMTFAGSGSYDGTLRIYLDGEEEAFIEDNALKILSGQLLAGEPLSSSVSPESDYYQRGHNLYLPIPYGKSCKITYECDSIKHVGNRWTPSIYYNINYRDYEDDVKVETLDKEILIKSADRIEETNRILISESRIMGNKLDSYGALNPGAELSRELQEENIAISGIEINIQAKDLNQALRSTILEIYFDESRTVWVPLGDFFASGFTLRESKTWFSKVGSDTTLYSKWIMPFKGKARIGVLNLGDQEVEIGLSVSTIDYRWNMNSMYFGAAWHEYNQIKTGGDSRVGGNDKHSDINFIDITGKGVYVGDAITIFNTVDAWWGEGDEKIYVDGEDFPSSIGTGTEDYYGYAWCRPETFSHPFIAQPSGEGNFHPGMTVNVRYRTLDAIPFKEEISANIELWHWVPALMNYALTSYFYLLPGSEINIKPDTSAVRIRVPEGQSVITEN